MSGPLLVFAHADEAHAFADVPHLVTGIGKINAAASLGERLAQGGVSEVVVLGTAGMIDDSLSIDTVYRVRAAIQHDFEFETPTVLLGADGSVTHGDDTQPAQGASPDDAASAVIATGDVFVKNDELRLRLRGEGANLVDMESYAYAELCRVFEMPITIFKLPSDFADSSTEHQTWDDIVAHKSEQLRQFAQERGLL